MKKIILAIGSITTAIIPVAAVIACGNKNEPKGNPSNEDDKNTGGNNNSSSNGVNIPSKYLNDPKTVDYINKTGYVPERPYDDYYESRFDSVADHYWSKTDDIFGDKEDERKTFYNSKYEKLNHEDANSSKYFSLSNLNYLPYLLFYDYAHKVDWSSYLIRLKIGSPEDVAQKSVDYPYKSDFK